MTISRVQFKHSVTVSGDTSPALTFDAAPTAGNLLVAIISIRSTQTITATPSGWSLAAHGDNSANGGVQTYIYYLANCGTTSTYTWTTSATASWQIQAAEYSGILTSSPLDKTAVNNNQSAGPVDSGTTATTSQATELWVAGLTQNNHTFGGSPTNSFTLVDAYAPSTNTRSEYCEKIVSSTGTANTSDTIDALANWSGAIATFKGTTTTTSTRTVPATVALTSLGLQRTVPATVALKSLGLSRTVPATAALKSLGLTRTVPATVPLTFRGTRTVPGTAALKSLGVQRTVPVSGALKSLGLTRTVPASAILAFIGTGMGSPYPWNYIKQQLVKVYDPNGNFVDVWRDAPLLDGFKEAIQSSTTPMRVKLPRRFDSFDEVGTVGALGSIAQGNTVKWFLFGPGLPATGLLRYQGVIDAYEPTIDDSGEEYVTVTVTPRGSAVGDVTVIGDVAFGTPGQPSTYRDPVEIFTYFFTTNDPLTGLPYTHPLTLDPTNPTTSGYATQYTFSNQQLNDIFDTILLLLPPNWYWRINVDNTVSLNVSPATAQNTFILGRHCVSLLYTKDWTQIKNIIYVQGGQDPNTGATITATKVGSDLTTYDPHYLPISETRIVDQNTANQYAAGLLMTNDRVAFRGAFRIFDYRGDPALGLGYDITTIRVGQSCQVIAPQFTTTPPTPPAYWDQGIYDVMYWDAAPNQDPNKASLWDAMSWDSNAWWDFSAGNALGQTLEIISYTEHFDYADLEVEALRPSQDIALARFQARLQSQSNASTSSVAIWGS